MSRYLKTEASYEKLASMQAKVDKLAEQYSRYDSETADKIAGISAAIEIVLESMQAELDRKAKFTDLFKEV